MAMQSPQHIMPMPHRPRKSPTPKSGTEKWGKPTHRARPPPATISRMPIQSSMPCGSGISGGPPPPRDWPDQLSCSYSRKCTSAAASLQERGGGLHPQQQHPVRMGICAYVRVCVRVCGERAEASTSVRASPPRHGCRTHRSAPHTPSGSRRPADARSKGFTISLPSSSQTFCPLTKPAWRRLPESRGREDEKNKNSGNSPRGPCVLRARRASLIPRSSSAASAPVFGKIAALKDLLQRR